MNVAVLGASGKPERYSNQAVALLKARGYTVFPVNPQIEMIHGEKVYPCLTQIPVPVDTVTVYVAAATSSALRDDLIQVKPRRVIFNPGAENPALQAALAERGVETIEACTLVLLGTHQF
jgi:predicted CoA-binding protein